MYIPSFSNQELSLVLQALITVAANPEALTLREQQFLQVLSDLHEGRNAPIVYSPIAPSQIAKVITKPYQRQWLVQMAIVMAIVEGKSTLPQLPQQLKKLRSLAEALSVKEQGLRVLREVAGGQNLLALLDVMRCIMGKLIKDAYQEEGIVGVINLVQPTFFATGGKDLDLAWRFRKLGLLPEDTLGRIFWEHFTEKSIIFPGEWGGIPERFVYHDFSHILSGYNTDPMGEMLVGGFQAGYTRKDGFMFFLFSILQCHWGIQLTPVVEASEGLFDIPLVMDALQRGVACKVDLSDHWNFWEVVDMPLEEVRDLYGIPPLCPSSIKAIATAGIIR
ncbi:MAG TPA: hypothetical protein VK211_28425 [Kamptonema sp.]|nr:hypothetical protein [Kamptonema sp.]